MHTARVLQTWLSRNCRFMHQARAEALVKVVDGVMVGGRATLTELGRNVRGDALEKHRIKCVDRLVGNTNLSTERLAVYSEVALWLVGKVERPWVIIDWSDVELGHEFLMLKAAVPVGGRAVSVYEEVHPLRRYNSPRTHRTFLKNLRAVLPQTCRPIVITDAGFRGPWFKAVDYLFFYFLAIVLLTDLSQQHVDRVLWRFLRRRNQARS